MVDESSRVLRADTLEIVQAISDVIKQMDIGMNANLVSLYGYDTSVHTKFALDKYTDKTTLLNELQSSNLFNRFHLPRTDTAEAIAFLVDHALTAQQGDRPDFPDAVVIIADPSTASISNIAFRDRLQLAGLSHDVIVVSLGSNKDEAQQVATDNTHVIHVPATSYFQTVFVPKVLQLLQQC